MAAQNWWEEVEEVDSPVAATEETPWWETVEEVGATAPAPTIPEPVEPTAIAGPVEADADKPWYEQVEIVEPIAPRAALPTIATEPQEGFLRPVADPFLNIAAGINDVVKGFSDAFGADNAVSQNLAKNSDWYRSLLSAGAKEDQEEIGRIMQEAEGQGVLAEIGAGLKALSVAPVDLVAQGIGSLIPFIATAGVGKAVGLSKAGIAVLQGVQGGAVGGGIVKGEIYSAVKDQLINSGVDEDKAEKAAQEAQAYNGKNLDQILLGVGLGVAASTTGADSAIRNLISRKVGKEAAEQVSEQAVQEVLRTGFVRGAAKSAAVEFATEGLQGGQEKLAANVAVGREGFDVDPMRGVVAQATLEGSIGALLAGGVGGVNAKVEQMDAREKVALRDAKKAAEEAKQNNAPASAAAVEEQINQTIEETPDERVARLQREAQEASTIELEEEVPVSGLPPQPVTPTPEAPTGAAEPAGAAIADQPSPNLPPRSDAPVDARPTRQEGESRQDFTDRRDVWDEQYGDLKRGGRTHNDDGTPYQPTILNEVMAQVQASGILTDEDTMAASIGTRVGLLAGQEVGKLLNNGWVWDTTQNRMVNPANPEQRPVDGIAEINRRADEGAKPTTPTPTEPAPIVPAVTQEQKAVAEAVSPAAVLPEQEPADIPDTRGQNRQFHGAREPIPELTEGYYNAANIYGGESTFYTTDAVDIAAGYQRRKPNSVVYEVTEKAPVNFFNMEERRPVEDWIRDFNPKTEGIPSNEFFDFAAELAAEKSNGTPNLREVMDEMRAEAANEGYSRDTVQEFFAMITENLEKQGYGGMTHIGGLQTNRPQHNVKIYFKPAEQLNLQPVDVRGNPVTPEGAPTPTAEPPALAPLRRVVKAEQTEDDVSGLVGQGLVELYNGQPVITQAGLETLPEAERPRLTPEARKIQIDTRTSEAAAEAISKKLRIGVDQVPPDVRMPAGWTIEGDIYIPPQPQEVGEEVTVYRGELPALEGGRQLAGVRDIGEVVGLPDIAPLAPFTYYSTSERDARGYLERDARILKDYQDRFGVEEGLKTFQSLHGFDPRTEGQVVSKKIRPRKIFDITEMGTTADIFKMYELVAKEMGYTLPENWKWKDVPREVTEEVSRYGLDMVGDPDNKQPTWQYFRNDMNRTKASLIQQGARERTRDDVRGSLFAQWLRKNGYDAVAMMHDTESEGPVKHILVINEDAAKAQDSLAPAEKPTTAEILQKPTGSQFQNPEEFRAAFDLRGQGHTRFAIRLDLMQEDGAITEDGKNLILATIWDNNTNDEFLSNMEMGSARKTVKSYGFGGRSRQTVEGGRVEQKPLLELIRATRRGGTEADKRTALTLNTFWHEFGHAGYYSLLDAKQKKAIDDAYNKTTRAGRRAFFAEGKSDIENAPYFSKYYAKNESEWFAQSFAEYVITQKSDQKGLVPVFEQLLDKIRAVFTKLFNRKEQVNLNDIFEFILRGEAYGQKPTWQGYTMSTKPAVYGTPRGQAISPEFTKRLLEREQPTTFEDERRQQIIDGISLKFKRSKNEYGNNEFKTEYDFGGRSEVVDKISFSLEQFDDSTVAMSYLPSKGGKYVNIKLVELEQEFKGRAAAERAIKKAIAEVEMDERVGGATEPAPDPPTFTEESPEAKTLSNLKASMEKVDAASEAKGGKPETQKVSEIAANWMESGGDERALQDAITENTNLSPANAAKVAKAIAKQYDIQQSIATAFLETQTGLSVEALPEGVTLPNEVDPDRPKPVMVRLFEAYMGVKVPPTKLTVNEKTALRDQIRLKAAANREAKKAQQATQAEVIDIIKAMELRGPVRPKQAAALAKRAAKVIWTSEKSMEAFVNYAEKVVINTNYDADLREAKAAQKRAQQLSKSEKVAAPQREVLADIAKIGVNMLDNPAEFAVAVNHYLRGFKSVVSPDYVVIPDAEITSYLSAMQTEADSNKAEFDRATNERLADKYGIPINELEKYLNAENIIRDLASYARREVVEGILTEKAQETLAGLKAYDQTPLRDEQRKILDEMVKVDPRQLDSEERQRFVRIGNNIILNNQTNGAEYFVATAKGQQMAREMAKDETAIAKNKAWVNLLPSIVSPKLQRGWALELQSVADTFRNAFGKGAMGKVYRMMGMLDLNMAQTKANTQLDQIQEEISAFYNGLEKKYKASARNQDGILAEGVVGFLIQKVPEKGETESLAQRRNLIQQDIRNRREDGDQERAEMANRIEALLQQLDGATVQDILNNLKQNYRPNYDSLMFLKDTLFPKYKEFLKRFDENFNDQANNYENPDYLPIGFVRAGPSLAITEEETGQFYDHVSLRPKQSSYTIKRADYTQLPTDQSTNTPKEIEFNLRRNAFDSLSDQITKAYTNPAWQRVNAFLKTPESVEVFGGRANRDFFIERLNRLRLSRMRRGALSRGYIEKTADVVSVIARKLGTGIALGGVYQTFKQAPDQLLTTLATTGRRDLLGKNAMDVLAQQLAPKTLRESTKMLNKFSIGRRGDASAGYKYINQMEGAQTRMERYFTESKWDQAKEQGSKIADIWMVALKKSDFVAAAGSWLTYYRADLAKRGIKFEGWEREAELVDTDQGRQDSAAYAEQMTDIYQGSSDPTQMATFAQSGKSGWENLWKSMFVPFNSFAVQQRMRLYSDARDALTKTGVDQKTGYLGLSGTIGGMILFHMVKRLFIPVLSGAGVGVLYGIMGVDVEEPDEEKKKEDLNKRWRQMQGEILANMLVGGTGQIIEAKTIDAFNYAAYLISVQTENESVLDDNGEVMPFSTYVKERSPFWRYQSFDSAYSLGMLEIGLGQAEKAVTQSKMLMDSEEMENFTPEEQRLLYFAAVSEWLYTMRLNDADLARLVDKARRDMIKAVKDREKELQRIRSGR